MSAATVSQITPPAIIVIFGAAGDLTRRKLLPAIYHLSQQNLLSEQSALVGMDRTDLDSDSYREHVSEQITEFTGPEFSQTLWDEKIKNAFFIQGDFNDTDSYIRLREFLAKLDKDLGTPGNYLFYLATPPRFFGEIANHLGTAGLTKETESGWRRIIIEKPFGHDLETARELNNTLHNNFAEHQIYRIDHYLGKETVQNIMTFRFGNGTIEPIWNHRYIDHVQITVAESLGVEGRANYYEHSGAMRDMVPNHILALLSVIAMEPPNSFDADAIRDEQTKVLRAVQPFTPEQVLTDTVRGQYGEGRLPDGSVLPAYRDEPRVAADSQTETFVAMKLMIDTWRWAGVPFYLRTGKRMPGRYTEILVQYRHAPNMMFRESLTNDRDLAPNRHVLRIQPNEGLDLEINAKVPGTLPKLSTVKMDFNYEDYFGHSLNTGYETLIYDCLIGDQTLFKRADNIEAGWQLVQPILDVWGALPMRNFPNYKSSCWGPEKADELLVRDGRKWRIPS